MIVPSVRILCKCNFISRPSNVNFICLGDVSIS